MKRILVLMLLLANFSGANIVLAAQIDAFVFETPEQEKIFHKLSGELRCLVCQNQAISDSNAGLASDLRVEIHGMLLAGKTEDEIVTFMVERYGDYVLYRPPFKPMTWLLWFGPFLAFAAGVFYVKRIVREQNAGDVVGDLSEAEIERMSNLQSEAEALHGKGGKNKNDDNKGRSKQGEVPK